MRSDRERLLDIMESIERIEKYAGRGREAFEREELVQVWIMHHLQIIGEAASRFSEGFRAQHPEVLWSKIVGMRNVLVHGYFGTDTAIVWGAVERDLPALKRSIEALLEDTA